MKLDKLEIENFKGLLRTQITPGKFNCLVGENNAGKSSVLQAIVFFLNRPPHLSAKLFYDPNRPVIFRGFFSAVDEPQLRRLGEVHRTKIEPLVNDGKFALVVQYNPDEKLEIKVLVRIPREERYRQDSIDELLKGKRAPAVHAAVQENYPEFLDGLATAANIGDAKAHLKAKLNELPTDSFEEAEAALPTGIASSISALLPEAIYIPAVRNLNDEMKTTQSTSFGRLLGLLIDDLSDDLQDISKSLENLSRLMNRINTDGQVTDDRHPKVRALEAMVEGYLAESFPQVKVELEVPPPDLKAILNSAQIYVNDGARDLIDQKGDGIKRCLTFALLRTYVQKLRGGRVEKEARQDEIAERPLIFLFEEPELYLHPKSQRILFGALASISETHQVAVTTHSPVFFEPGITAVFIRVAKKDVQPKPVGELHPVNFELDRDKAEIFRLAKFEHAEAGFFSSRVVLFEGESDDAFLGRVAKVLLPDWDFAARNIAMVRVGGKGNFSKFRQFFEAFGIEVKIIADLDAVIDGFQHLGVSPECVRMRAEILQVVDRRIAEENIRADIGSARVKKKVNQEGWKVRYENAKEALFGTVNGEPMSPEARLEIEGLFLWEAEESRLKALQSDHVSREAIEPLLVAMRNEGICVLSKGAIEDYYPVGVEVFGPKPQRALHAAAAVTTREIAVGLSDAGYGNQATEFERIFASIFAA